MPFSSSADHLPRRNARSFDLDDSAAKAAAWVWHLHTSKPGITTEGRFISSQSRRRSSSNFDRKSTRFQQEASTTTTVRHGRKTETPVWDCGSTLYDTFELVAFGNRLDRSLMEAVPITPPQPVPPQQHHMKSPLHEPNGILRTLSMPRSLSQQTSKDDTARATPTANQFKQSKSYNSERKASSTGTVQKASTKWSRVGKLMNVIKRVVILHKQVSFVGCKRSINVIESTQRPLDPISERKDEICARDNQFLVNQKVGANLNTSNSRDSESVGDDLSIHYPKVRSNSGIRGSYKLSTPSKSNDECNIGDLASIPKKITAYNGESLGSTLSTNPKIRSNSDSTCDGLSFEHKKIKPRRKFVEDESVNMDDRIKGSYFESVNVEERSRDYYKHMHHHHHHHHHHHYLHHYLASESARLSPETMSKICADQSWLI